MWNLRFYSWIFFHWFFNICKKCVENSLRHFMSYLAYFGPVWTNLGSWMNYLSKLCQDKQFIVILVILETVYFFNAEKCLRSNYKFIWFQKKKFATQNLHQLISPFIIVLLYAQKWNLVDAEPALRCKRSFFWDEAKVISNTR